jgi:hypothetical protein|tara:strand:- start:8455 stop:8766 length:312 start_codon:yes stop_codon:yes gene_type:complete
MRNRETEKELFIELINYQLMDHGVTYEDVKDNPQWYMEYTTTPEKEELFRAHIIKRARKVLKINAKRAGQEAMWFILQWGLTTNYPETPKVKDTSKSTSSAKN